MSDNSVENTENVDPVEEPEQAPADAPAEESVEAPAEETVAEVEVPVEEPVVEAEAPVEEPVAEVEAPVEDEPVDEAVEEPAADAGAPADEAPADEPEAEDAPAEPTTTAKKKKKRLPRSERPTRTKVKRAKSAERKPIVRLPKPEHERRRRQVRQGLVVSDAMDKTIIVRVDTVKTHPRYKKVVRRSTRLHAHDEANQAKIGDIVRVVETHPLSRLKRWRLTEVVEAAK